MFLVQPNGCSELEEAEMTPFVRTLAGLAVAATLAATPAFAETVSLKADLKGASEVPPVIGSGTGSVTVTYDTASRRLS